MDFSIPESLQTVLPAIRELLERSVMPLEPGLRAGPFAELVPALAAVRETVKARGLWAPQLPRSLGGMGLGLLEFALVGRGAGAQPPGSLRLQLPGPRRRQHGAAPGIRHGGPAGTLADAPGPGRDPELLRHDRAGSPGSNPVWMGTRAVRDGDDYIIDGRKWFASAPTAPASPS